MRGSAISDEDVAARVDGDVTWIIKSARDEGLRLARQRGEPHESPATEREQPSLRVEAQAARIRHGHTRGDAPALDVHDEQLVLPHERANQLAISRRDAAEDINLVAAIEP